MFLVISWYKIFWAIYITIWFSQYITVNREETNLISHRRDCTYVISQVIKVIALYSASTLIMQPLLASYYAKWQNYLQQICTIESRRSLPNQHQNNWSHLEEKKMHRTSLDLEHLWVISKYGKQPTNEADGETTHTNLVHQKWRWFLVLYSQVDKFSNHPSMPTQIIKSIYHICNKSVGQTH